MGNVVRTLVKPLVDDSHYCSACDKVRKQFNQVLPWVPLYSPNVLLDISAMMRRSSAAWWVFIIPLVYVACAISTVAILPARWKFARTTARNQVEATVETLDV